MKTQAPILSSTSIVGDDVVNAAGDELGSIKDLMVDTSNGRVEYAVLSFGGVLGLGDKLFAVPMDVLQLDTENERFTLDVPKEQLENAPGFDKDDWPDFASEQFRETHHAHWAHVEQAFDNG